MSFAQSIYGNARRLVANSEKAPQYAQAAIAGAAVFGGANGGAKGAVSSDSTVVGGGVGGAMFGAGVGAGAAFALNRSAGAREIATSALKFGKSKMQGGFFKPRPCGWTRRWSAIIWISMR